MPPLPFAGNLHIDTKRRNACAARSAFGSQKELTSFLETSVSKPNRTRSSTASDTHPSADCSRRSGDHIGHHRLGGHLGFHRGRDKLGSCCSRDLGRDRGPCPYLGLDRDLCHGRGMRHSVEPSVPMPKPNRR